MFKFLSRLFIIGAPCCLLFGFNKGALKYKGQKGYYRNLVLYRDCDCKETKT